MVNGAYQAPAAYNKAEVSALAYDRHKSVSYARKWAYGRNPQYYDFTLTGGDCTNFVSQCLYEGCGEMNYTKDMGWYYLSPHDRAAAWTGVEYLYRFLTQNQGAGPKGKDIPLEDAEMGDIIQLSFDGTVYAHSLLIVEHGFRQILVAAHDYDAYGRNINSYDYRKMRVLRIGCDGG